jgi:hypothetical protein
MHGPLLGKAARASYATYVTHPLVLTAVMVLFASVALAPEIKFVLVATSRGGRLLHGWLRADPGAGHLQGALTQQHMRVSADWGPRPLPLAADRG